MLYSVLFVLGIVILLLILRVWDLNKPLTQSIIIKLKHVAYPISRVLHTWNYEAC